MRSKKLRRTNLLMAASLMLIILLIGIGFSQIAYANEDGNARHDFTENDIKEFTDGLLQKQLEEYHIAGAAISIVKDGKILYENGYGIYNKEKDKKVSPQSTLFRIGSVTKLFTWTAVMQLAEKGEIDIDKDINFYLKDFKIPNTFDKPITMRNLMTHTPGFDDRLTNLFNSPDSDVIALGTYLKDTMPKRIYTPGEIIAYSNYGAALAGLIVQQVSGQKYENYVNENIIKPLGMKNTFFEQPVPEAFRSNASLGFSYNNGKYKGSQDALIQLVPAGAISSTADDMAKFITAHLQNGRYEDIRILNEDTANEMHSQQLTMDKRLPGMCLGFMESFRNGKRIIWHSGGSQLFK
jgi:CubicO group peptidase (beta-lactamase class C family)